MFLSKRNIYIFLFSYVSILILFYSSTNFNSIIYLAGNIKNFFYNGNNNDFKIIDIKNNQYIKLYKNTPGNFIHSGSDLFISAKKGDAVKDIARSAISYTNYYTLYDLQNAIIKRNGLGNHILKQDMFIYIPDILPSVIRSLKNTKKPDLIYSRGLYFTGNSSGSRKFPALLAEIKKLGINTVVFDVKDVNGDVNYFSSVTDVRKYNTHEKRTIDNLDMLIRIFKQEGIYSIARIAVFRDHLLVRKNPGLAIRSKRTGGIWTSSKELWCDPTNKYAQDYNIQLAVELAEKGVDEIQFDYIRFPTTGDLGDSDFAYHFGRMTKESAITHFLNRAYDEISGKNSLLSIDIFGVIGWEKEIDIVKTGQRVSSLAKYCDILCPMLYPSHFENDFDGFANPGDEPYYFINEGSKKIKLLAGGKPVRPWLQAFGWRISAGNYNENYILKQISACRDSGAQGYLFWNASNSYDVVYKTFRKLAEMKVLQEK
jgi:hypothetical protein